MKLVSGVFLRMVFFVGSDFKTVVFSSANVRGRFLIICQAFSQSLVVFLLTIDAGQCLVSRIQYLRTVAIR